MPEQVNLCNVSPLRQITDEEYLDQTKGEIRGYSRLVVTGIINIGKKLAEAKAQVGHGKYQKFVREQLGFTDSAVLRFVQSFEFSKTPTLVDLESVQIDASALYLLAAPSIPDEVRRAALKEGGDRGNSHAEVQKLIADAKAEAAAKAKEEADKEAAAKLSETKKAIDAAAKKTAKDQATLSERVRQSDLAIVEARQRITELESAAATVGRKARAGYEAKYEGKLVISEEELRTRMQAAVDEMTAPLNSEIHGLAKQVDQLSKQRDDALSELADVRKQQVKALEAEAARLAGFSSKKDDAAGTDRNSRQRPGAGPGYGPGRGVNRRCDGDRQSTV